MCGNCDYMDEFHLGVGMAYSRLENVIDLVHYIRRKKIMDILQNHTLIPGSWEHPNPLFTHRLYRCEKCNKLYNRFYVKICYDIDLVYETIFRCNRCKIQLKVIDPANIPDHPCPVCGKATLNTDSGIMWD